MVYISPAAYIMMGSGATLGVVFVLGVVIWAIKRWRKKQRALKIIPMTPRPSVT